MISLRKGLGLLCVILGVSFVASAFMWDGVVDFIEQSFPDGQDDLLFIRMYNGLLILAGIGCICTLFTKTPLWISIWFVGYGMLTFLLLMWIFDPQFLATESPNQFQVAAMGPFVVTGIGTVITGTWLLGILGSRNFQKKPT